MSKGTILVIGSNGTELEAKGGGTITIGQFLNETAVPLMTLVAAGYDFVLATPTGEKPHMDAPLLHRADATQRAVLEHAQQLGL